MKPVDSHLPYNKDQLATDLEPDEILSMAKFWDKVRGLGVDALAMIGLHV